MSRGKIFVSSTIYDFRDLRSALKFWLNEAGFDVLMSEFSDFQKDVSMNSFDACLDTISKCDYYLLFIGNRVGGMYDSLNKISITQQEYRVAYDCAKKGLLKILVFVRKEIWNIKEDRKMIEKYLKKTSDLNDEIIKKVSNSKGKFVNDAEFIFSFIDEVTRKDEMKLADGLECERPVNNWIHTFDGFSDIIDVLKYSLELNISIQQKISISNVVREIGVNIAYLFYKNSDNIIPIFALFPREDLICEYDKFIVKREHLSKIQIFLINSQINYDKMSVKHIEHALHNGVFFDMDKESGCFMQSRIHVALQRIYDEILFYKKIEESIHEDLFKLNEYINQLKSNLTDLHEECTLDYRFFLAVSLHDRMSNIFELAKYIFAIIERTDEPFNFPKLYDRSPLNNNFEKSIFGDVEFEELVPKFFVDNSFINKLFG